jgi:hypothetical protein
MHNGNTILLPVDGIVQHSNKNYKRGSPPAFTTALLMLWNVPSFKGGPISPRFKKVNTVGDRKKR